MQVAIPCPNLLPIHRSRSGCPSGVNGIQCIPLAKPAGDMPDVPMIFYKEKYRGMIIVNPASAYNFAHHFPIVCYIPKILFNDYLVLVSIVTEQPGCNANRDLLGSSIGYI